MFLVAAGLETCADASPMYTRSVACQFVRNLKSTYMRNDACPCHLLVTYN